MKKNDPNRLIEVSAKDLKIVTDTILNDWYQWVESPGGRQSWYECKFCHTGQPDGCDEEEHDVNCPILIARSICPKE